MSQITIGRKLMVAFGAMLIVALALGISSLSAIGKLSASLDTAVNRTIKKLDLSCVIEAAAANMLAGQRGVLAYSYARSAAGIESASELYETSAQQWAGAVQEIRPLLITAEGRQLVAELESSLAAWRSAFNGTKPLAAAGNVEAAFKVATSKGLPPYRTAGRAAKRLRALQGELLEKDRAAAASLSGTSRMIALTMGGICLLIGGVILMVVRQITQTLQQAAADLSESAEQVASASRQVSSSSQALAHGASEQAASIEETSASSEEIASMTRKNADNSHTAADLMVETTNVVGEANRTLEGMESSMREINASSDKIGKIIKVIDDIAFQTNILALNAAVEAARAGEAGMGFAVVADEVRNLAQRSAQAAKDTAGLIEDSIEKSKEGRGRLEQVSTSVRSLTEGAQKVRTLVDEVKLGSEEQARGIEQITRAISQMEQVTQKSAANAEETASAGEEMSTQAENLNGIVLRLRQMVGGAERERHSRARRPERAKSSGAIAVAAAVSAPSAGAKAKAAIPLDHDFKEF